jgi:hypothetical protein
VNSPIQDRLFGEVSRMQRRASTEPRSHEVGVDGRRRRRGAPPRPVRRGTRDEIDQALHVELAPSASRRSPGVSIPRGDRASAFRRRSRRPHRQLHPLRVTESTELFGFSLSEWATRSASSVRRKRGSARARAIPGGNGVAQEADGLSATTVRTPSNIARGGRRGDRTVPGSTYEGRNQRRRPSRRAPSRWTRGGYGRRRAPGGDACLRMVLRP